MPYVTTALNDNSNYTVSASLVPAGSIAVTILTLKTNGSVSVETLLNPNSSSRSIGNGVARIMIIVNAQANGTGTFTVMQGAQTLVDDPIGSSGPVDMTYTFAVV